MSTSAVRALKRRDKILKRIMEQVGPCTLAPRRRYFPMLCQAIISQQLSTKVAETIYDRFSSLFDRRTPAPAGFADLDDAGLRGVGLSRQKVVYLRDLAEKYANATIPHRRFRRMGDDAVIESLTQVKGIGVWTAQMFLIFVLHRLDVLPVDDLGIRKAAQRLYGFAELPGPAELIDVAEVWRPYRSIASWYLWQSLDTTPLKRNRARSGAT